MIQMGQQQDQNQINLLVNWFEELKLLVPPDLENRKTHEAHHNDTPPSILLKEFRKARDAFLERIDALVSDDFEKTSRHPRLDTLM